MRLTQTAQLWLRARTVGALWLCAAVIASFAVTSTASAAPIYENDFSSFETDFAFLPSLAWVQASDGVEVAGTDAWNAFLTRPHLDVLALSDEGARVTLTIEEMEISEDASLAIVYYDEFGAFMSGLVEVPLPALTPGENTAIFGVAPPAGAVTFRPQFRLGEGNAAVVDHLLIATVPEPGTLALVGLGLGLIGFMRRRIC